MAITVANIQTQMNSYIGDASTDRIAAIERFQYITEAVAWLQTELDNDHSIRTYSVYYFDTLNYYKLNTAISDVLEGNALRKISGEYNPDLTRKDARAIAIDIGAHAQESSYAFERRDGNLYLGINHCSKYPKLQVTTFDSLTADGGTWVVDAINSDASNLRVDDVDGSNNTTGCLAFDVVVGQSANNRATIFNSSLTQEDLTGEKDLNTWILDIKFPDVTNITSVTFYWGSDASNYYSVTSTTAYDGSALIADWNTMNFAWLGATVTGTPDYTAVDYIRIDVNYGSGQTSETSFKLDNLRLVRPEKLTLHYTSWNVGASSGGTQLKAFTATTDVPYFSGQYDQYLYAVAHKAASLAFRALRLQTESTNEATEATDEMNRVRQVIPKSRPGELKNFRIKGVRFNRGGQSRRRYITFQ